MAIYRRFRVQQKYVNGQPTEEYRLGVEIDSTDYNSLEECNRGSDCTELEYRWVDMESADDYICEGTNKYKKQMKQQKCVTEEAWTNVYPYEYQKGELIEHDSFDCGYSPTGEYHIYGTTDGHGSINISPSKEYYSSTDIVTITALPSTDYMFSQYNYGRNLNYGSVTYSSVLSLTMSNNWYVSAVFKSAQYRVYDLTTFGGSLTISPSKEYYNPTDIVTITAVPNTNYSFSNYSYGSTSGYGQNTTNSILTLTMSNDWYVKGNFVFESASSGSLYYSYNNGTESWYNWSWSTFTKNDNRGTTASIIIDYGGVIQSLSSSAFSSQSYLISISLPNCTDVDENVFDSCYSLRYVNLPNCSSIEFRAFNNCQSLQSVNLPLCEYLGTEVFRYCITLSSIDLPNCSYLGSGVFTSCLSLISVSLPLCSYIEDLAFNNCISLSYINLPNCSYADRVAFYRCSGLVSINLPLCSYVGENAFNGCISLPSINLPNCSFVGFEAFESCSNLSIVHLPKVTYIGNNVFRYTPIETLYMNQITSVPSGGDPFGKSFSYLKSIIIPCFLVNDFLSHSIWSKYSSYFVCTGEDDLKEIFTATDGGGNVTLDPEGGIYYSATIVNIGYTAKPGYKFSYFQYGSTPAYGSTVLNESFSLVMNQNWYVSVNFGTVTPNTGYLYYLYSNGNEGLYYWNKSTLSSGDNRGKSASIIIDYDGVIQSLPSDAFYKHSYLTSINLPNCTYVGANAFNYCESLTNFILPNCSYLGAGAFHHCLSLTNFSLQNCSYIGNGAFEYCKSLTNVSLPNCTYIDDEAFYYCISLTSIDLPNCSYVGFRAFYYCSSLSYISLPNCLYVSGYAFHGCSSLTSISLANCSYVSAYAFQSCKNLSSIDLPNCTYVESNALAYCTKLSIVHLPKVTYFGFDVFYYSPIETLYMDQITSVPSGSDPYISISYIKSIFIPSSLLNDFLSNTIWSEYSSYFVCV